MKVQVEQVAIPDGSTIGFGMGTTDGGTVEVLFGGDHRAMQELGEAIAESPEPIEVDIPDWAVLAFREKRLR